MSLPTTFTTDIGDFANPVEDGASVVYYADSPQGDLLGRPSLTFTSEVTKAGIARTLMSIKMPVYNAALGKYDGFIKHDEVLNRALSAPTALSTDVMTAATQIKGATGVVAAVVNAAF